MQKSLRNDYGEKTGLGRVVRGG